MFRYNFTVAPFVPPLSSLSDVRQQISDIEVNIGNPDLDPYPSYTNQLRIIYQVPRLYVQLYTLYTYRKNPVSTEVQRIDYIDGSYLFEYRSANQRNLEQLFGQLNVQYYFIPDKLSAYGYVGVSNYTSRGNNYTHHFTGCYGGGGVSLILGSFSANASFNSRYKSLQGETISYNPMYGGLSLGYKIKDIRVGASYAYPFKEGWSSGSKSLSELANNKSWTYIRDNANMVMVNVSWNFNYGRKYESGKKRFNNEDKDSGIVR